MKGITHILGADGDIVRGIHYAPLSAEFMSVCVGGKCQEVPSWTTYMLEPCRVFCYEDGKMKGHPVNKEATLLWRAQYSTSDHLVGNILVVTGDPEFLEAL